MKQILTVFVWVFLFIVNFQTKSQAQSVEELREWGMDIDKVIKMNRLLKAYSWLKEFSGIVIVAKDDHPVFKYTNGYANLDYKIPNSLTTRYNLSNITHIITAISIMQFIEKNQISRYDLVKDYISDIPAAIGEQVTIHHLLTHTSGIKDYYQTFEYIANFSNITQIDELIEIILKQPIEFAVGTKVAVSPSNYVLLAKIVESLSNMPFRQYIEENIFQPAEMDQSGAYFWDETVNNKAIGYTFKENGDAIIPANYWGAFPFGSDALYSTVEDLSKFVLAFNNEQLLNAESKKEMMSYGIPAADSTTFHYGWRSKKLNDQEVLLQNGSIQGLSVDLRHYPSDGYTTIVLSSYFSDKAQEIGGRLEQILYDENFVVAAHPLAFFLNEIIKESGVEFVANNLDNILKTNGFKLEKVWTLYSLGYDLMDNGKMAEAGRIFKINLSKFPQEPMAYDSMGAYYDKNKEYSLALSNFQRKLQFLPNDKRALSMVKYLKKKINDELSAESN